MRARAAKQQARHGLWNDAAGSSRIKAPRRAGQAILRQFRLLQDAPALARPWTEESELRALIIGFGVAGYVARYRHAPNEDAVYVPAFRHQRQAGY